MKEAKTFEEYILNELTEAKENAKKSAELLETAMVVRKAQNTLLDIFRKRLEKRTLPDGTWVIDMSPVFSTFDKEEFRRLEVLLIMKEEDDE